MFACRRVSTPVCTALIAVGVLVSAAHADMYLVRRVNLGSFFGAAGNNPFCVASDGTYAYIGGYSASATARDIGILKINLTDPNDATLLAGATQSVQQFRFYDGLVVRDGVLYALCDRPQGTAPSTNVRAINTATGALVDTFDGDPGNGDGIVTEPAAMTVGATGGLAFDPGFGGSGTGLSLLGYGSGRRALIDINDGTTIYDTSTGMKVADTHTGGCTVADLTAWRDHVYDASGNVYARRSNQVQKSTRDGANSIDPNAYVHLTDALNADGTPKADCGDGQPVALRVAATVVSQHLDLLPASSAHTGGQELLVFNDHWSNATPTFAFLDVVKVITTTGALPSPAFQLLNGDGTPLTSTQTPPGYAVYDFFYVASTDELLIVDYTNRLLFVFGAQPPPGACCYPDGHCEYVPQVQCGGQWLGAGITCTSNPCPQPPGACCYPDGHCEYVTQAQCGGQWLGYGTVCDPNPCPVVQTGACCLPSGYCQVMTQTDCTTASGRWYGASVPCAGTGTTCPQQCKGDMNCDGRVTFSDIDPFVAALSGESNWHKACPWLNADCNGSGTVTFADIDPFVAVIGTTCP